MSRFITFASSMTSVGSTLPVGVRDKNDFDGKGLLQIVSQNPFSVRIYGTLDFDYNLNVGSNWVDITDRFRAVGESSADWVLVGSSYQQRKQSAFGQPLSLPGIYALDSDYVPAAIFAGILQVTSGDNLKLLFGF